MFKLCCCVYHVSERSLFVSYSYPKIKRKHNRKNKGKARHYLCFQFFRPTDRPTVGRLGKSYIVSIIGCTDLLEHVLRGDGFEDVLLGRFLDLATHQQLVQDEVGLLEVEDDVQLAYLQFNQALDFNRKVIPTNPLTLPKYLSSSSTYRWMISSVSSSLSFCSIAQQKYKLAYLKRREICQQN